MELRQGIPDIADLEALTRQDDYNRHVTFNQRFLQSHRPAIERYGRLWGTDPFKLWSRRWEYPFTVAQVEAYARQIGKTDLRILDAGSGVTYVPYLICSELQGASVVCCDSNESYRAIFDEVNRQAATADGVSPPVSFEKAMLQKLPFADKHFDVVCCISVLEHTDQYGEILDEFARVLRPDGLLVLTFDLSLDGKFNLSQDKARQLLAKVRSTFELDQRFDTDTELARMSRKSEILSTDHVKRTDPSLLPWKYPMLKAAHDLLHGHGWTGGFRSKSVFCMTARARQA